MPDEFRSVLWFERLYTRLGLPFWVGAPLIGFLPFFVSAFACFVLAGLLSSFLTGLVFIMPFFFIVNIYAQAAARYVRRRVEALVDYSAGITEETAHFQQVAPLSGLRGAGLFTIVSLAVLLPLFNSSLPGQYTIYQTVLIGILPWIYFTASFGTFFWVLGYSMYTMFRIGKHQLKLKHFIEDRTLGLRPFGSASLRFTGIFIGFVILFAIPQILQGFVNAPFLALYSGMILLALLLFLFPLLGLHDKLVSEKRAIIERLMPQYKKLVQEMESRGFGNIDEKLVGQLNITRQVIQEAQQIHAWPFDTGIIIRLSAIIFSVIGILLSRIIALALHL